ncbi:hypothetical protein CCR75_001774 [Bremia lactucae]|uniref:Uncharacterized protein n=1 Tax=Bremia lactucae TaxID=4779 RepID=A0A976IHD2_BRELC|nr:hypothetical protein CCR75_001774 [Bremia lactucae]
MVVSKPLTVQVQRLEADDNKRLDEKLSVQLAVGNDKRQTQFVSVGSKIGDTWKFDVSSMADSANVHIEVFEEGRETPLVSEKQSLREFASKNQMTFTYGATSDPHTIRLVMDVDYKSSTQEGIVAAASTHRPWFMRASYYYTTTKNVYDYATSFVLVKPFARLGEATVNTVLATVTGKTLADVDQSLMVPVLGSVDSKVDATISMAFTKLYQGQLFAVNTKNKAVRAVSNVVHKTGSTAVNATTYTTNKVLSTSGAAVGAVIGVAEFTSSQVKHASSSTFGAVRGVTYFFLSHVPILGPKIRA